MGELTYEGHRIEYDSYGEGKPRHPARARPADEPPHVRASWAGPGRARQPGDPSSTCSATAAPTAPRTCAFTRCRSSPDKRGPDRPPRARLGRRRRHLARRQRRPGVGRPRRSGSGASSSRCRYSTTPWSRWRHLCAGDARPAARPAPLRGRLTGHLGRSAHQSLIHIGLDWPRQRPGPSLAVLEGLLLGETAPHREERLRMTQPALSSATRATRCTPSATRACGSRRCRTGAWSRPNSILEWRLSSRLGRRARRLRGRSMAGPVTRILSSSQLAALAAARRGAHRRARRDAVRGRRRALPVHRDPRGRGRDHRRRRTARSSATAPPASSAR